MPDDSSPSLLSSGVGSDEFRRKLGILSRGRRCFSVIVGCFVSASSGFVRKATTSWSLHGQVNHRSLHSMHSGLMDKSEGSNENLIDHMESKNFPFRAVQNFLALSLPLSLIISVLRSPTILKCRGDIFQTGYTLILFS